ncbi:MAG: M20/M25/M40 family metallo-hydrolase [Anaerolineae bacterium]
MNSAELWNLVESHQKELIAFTRRLIQTPSMPGREGAVAALIRAEMEHMGYDEVWIDEVGNVIGRIAGGDGPSLMFNGHMDHVDAGDPARWPCPPFSGEVRDGELWGRASVDMKGALAAMVYAGGLIKQRGVSPPGSLYVTGVVQEEVGGLGARHLARSLSVQRVVVGEASHNHLRRGHRGRIELIAHWEGRSVHASMPDLGVNPHFSLARFINGLRDLPMTTHPEYGTSTAVPTCIHSEPVSANVTPSAIHLVLDWRNVPGEGPEEITVKLTGLLDSCLEPGCRGRIEIASKELISYTGVQAIYPDVFPSFTTAADHPWLRQAQELLTFALNRPVQIGTWRFATDGGHFAEAGMTVIGFGPGDDRLVHTVEERLPVDQLIEGTVGYMALGLYS